MDSFNSTCILNSGCSRARCLCGCECSQLACGFRSHQGCGQLACGFANVRAERSVRGRERTGTTATTVVFPSHRFSGESEKCFAHVGVFRITARLLALQPVCASCALTCMRACAWPGSQCALVQLCPALGHSQAGPTTAAGPCSSVGTRAALMRGMAEPGNPRPASTGQWKGFKGRAALSAGGKLTPSDKTWHFL